MRDQQRFRANVLRQHGAGPSDVEELLPYNRNAFEAPPPGCRFPLDDEPFVEAWVQYAEAAEHHGVYDTLKEKLVQFQFPVADGISQDAAYQAAVRKGHLPPRADARQGLRLNQPNALRLLLHPTPAGRIPVLTTTNRADFVTLVQALTRRNEPSPIPASMGACIVAGYNNWARIRALKRQWKANHPDAPATAWIQAFRRIIPQKDLYQDRFILLSDGPYSAVPAETLGLTDATWRTHSLTLRLEHECTHYFTRRVLGTMRHVLFDELLADYMGLVAAIGRFRADWFLHFMGLERFPHYREGGRLQNYRGTLSDDAFRVLQVLVKSAADHLDDIDARRPLTLDTLQEKAWMLMALSRLTLEHLASDDAEAIVREALARVQNDYGTVAA